MHLFNNVNKHLFFSRQIIEIHNTHKDAISISVSDQLPLSTDDKIKVTLITPRIKTQIKKGEHEKLEPIRLNSRNNIEWDINMKSTEKKKIVLEYTIECPAGVTVSQSLIEYSSGANFNETIFQQNNDEI